MPTTVQSSIGSAVATSTGDPASEPGATSTQYISDTTMILVTGADGGSGGFGATALADGAAFGTDTFTAAQIAASAVDGTYADAVSVAVMVTSAAQSSDGSAAALATAIAGLIGNGNVMIGITHSASATTTDSSGQTTVTVAFASVDALQFSTDGTGNVTVEDPDCGCGGSNDDPGAPDPSFVTAGEDSVLNGANLDGNLALFDIVANAFGDNTLADVTVDATAFQDQFSGVTAVVFVVVD